MAQKVAAKPGSRHGGAGPEAPGQVPLWLERRHGVRAFVNPLSAPPRVPLASCKTLRSASDAGDKAARRAWVTAGGGLQVDPALLGLAEATKAALEAAVNRGAPDPYTLHRPLRAQDLAAWHRAQAENCAGEPLRPSDRKALLVVFVSTFLKFNRWVDSSVAPVGADLPLESVLQLAWWAGYQKRPPTPNGARTLRRLLGRWL